MAIDNAEKRRNIASLLNGLFPPSVTPNASKDEEWRQQAGWGYSGIATVTAATILQNCAITLIGRQNYATALTGNQNKAQTLLGRQNADVNGVIKQ